MDSSAEIVHSEANPETGYEAVECRGPPFEGECHGVIDATMTSREKEAQEHVGQREASESTEADHCDRQPLIEDQPVVELLELQKRMFQST
jgi:hypothetical protein